MKPGGSAISARERRALLQRATPETVGRRPYSLKPGATFLEELPCLRKRSVKGVQILCASS